MSRIPQNPSEGGPELREQASSVAQNLREMGSTVAETAGEYYEAGKEKAMEWTEKVEDFVRERPLQSLAIAAGVGLLLGILWKRS